MGRLDNLCEGLTLDTVYREELRCYAKADYQYANGALVPDRSDQG